MKKFLLAVLMAVLTVGAAVAQVSDKLQMSNFSQGSTAYGTKRTYTSTVTKNEYLETSYHASGFQFNTNTNGKKAGFALANNVLDAKIKSITIETTATNSVSVYVQNEPYKLAGSTGTLTDFTKGTKIGTLNKTTLTIDVEAKGDYKYFSLCEAVGGSIVVTSVTVEYAPAGPTDATVSIEDINTKYSENLVLTPAITAPEGLEFTYTSSDETVVSNDLKVLKPGIAEITASWEATDKYNAGSTPFTVNIDKGTAVFAWSAASVELPLGATEGLPVLNNPQNLTVLYFSKDDAVATIGEDDGVITLVDVGSTFIYAMGEGNDFYETPEEAVCTITVTDPNAVLAPVITPETGEYFVGQQVSMSCATPDASILYSISEDGVAAEWIAYTEPFALNVAGDYLVHAKAVKGDGESEVVDVMYTIKKHVSEFGFAQEDYTIELGKTAVFEPVLNNPDGRKVEWTIEEANGALVAVPGQPGKFLVLGTCEHAMITAATNATETHEQAYDVIAVTVTPELVISSVDATFDFTDLSVYDDKTIELIPDTNVSGNEYALVNQKTCTSTDGVVITMSKKATTTGNGIRAYKSNGALDLRVYKSNSFTIAAPGEISSIVFVTSGTDSNIKSFTANAGSMTDAADKQRTWTPGATAVNSVTFTASGTVRFASITVTYIGASEGAGHVAPEFAFAAEDIYLETGEPVATLSKVSEGLEVVYLVDGKEFDGTTFEDEGEYLVEAYTFGNETYLPAYASTIAIVAAPKAVEYLTLHYTHDGKHLHWTNAVTVPVEDGVAKFENITIVGYDIVDDVEYGHMFFSLWQQPEVALLAEETWADFSAQNVTFTPANHLTMVNAEGDDHNLVRNRKGTFEAIPNVFRMPAHRIYNLSVNIDQNNLADGNHTVTFAKSELVGVEGVTVEAADETWYTIEGLRVEQPAKGGVYIRVRGTEASKVYVR